jgi:hypothetical protein
MKAGTSEGGSMLNQFVKHIRDTHSWVLNPGRLIDRFLDHLDKLHGFVLPAVDEPSYRVVEIEVRRRQFSE